MRRVCIYNTNIVLQQFMTCN